MLVVARFGTAIEPGLLGFVACILAAVMSNFQEAPQLLGEAGAQGDFSVVEPVTPLVSPRAAGFEHTGQAGDGVAIVGMQRHQADATRDGQAIFVRCTCIVSGGLADEGQHEEAGEPI